MKTCKCKKEHTLECRSGFAPSIPKELGTNGDVWVTYVSDFKDVISLYRPDEDGISEKERDLRLRRMMDLLYIVGVRRGFEEHKRIMQS